MDASARASSRGVSVDLLLSLTSNGPPCGTPSLLTKSVRGSSATRNTHTYRRPTKKFHSNEVNTHIHNNHAAVIQWNHACSGVQGVSKLTGSNPVHGPSVVRDEKRVLPSRNVLKEDKTDARRGPESSP
ncbi:hypothetical protein E2C01_041025 [Portunus trituberculatus]|uniref:Uncharacterized protein n=1 Tax=Portunus trituberculatus TaxID=210409 RepID=A0A5B7FQC0_PORTR|nr:hypothetical protein [Portunus trituberculatus]